MNTEANEIPSFRSLQFYFKYSLSGLCNVCFAFQILHYLHAYYYYLFERLSNVRIF